MRCYYAYRHTNGSPLEFLRFETKADRDAWVAEGWGRLPCRADDVTSGASRGLPWKEETLSLQGGNHIPVAVYAVERPRA